MTKTTDNTRYIDHIENNKPKDSKTSLLGLLYFKNTQNSLDNVINGFANIKNNN